MILFYVVIPTLSIKNTSTHILASSLLLHNIRLGNKNVDALLSTLVDKKCRENSQPQMTLFAYTKGRKLDLKCFPH